MCLVGHCYWGRKSCWYEWDFQTWVHDNTGARPYAVATRHPAAKFYKGKFDIHIISICITYQMSVLAETLAISDALTVLGLNQDIAFPERESIISVFVEIKYCYESTTGQELFFSRCYRCTLMFLFCSKWGQKLRFDQSHSWSGAFSSWQRILSESVREICRPTVIIYK